MRGDLECVDPLVNGLRGQPGQTEALVIMKHFLENSVPRNNAPNNTTGSLTFKTAALSAQHRNGVAHRF